MSNDDIKPEEYLEKMKKSLIRLEKEELVEKIIKYESRVRALEEAVDDLKKLKSRLGKDMAVLEDQMGRLERARDEEKANRWCFPFW